MLNLAPFIFHNMITPIVSMVVTFFLCAIASLGGQVLAFDFWPSWTWVRFPSNHPWYKMGSFLFTLKKI